MCLWTFHKKEFEKTLRVEAPLRDFALSITKLRNLLPRLVAEGFAWQSSECKCQSLVSSTSGSGALFRTPPHTFEGSIVGGKSVDITFICAVKSSFLAEMKGNHRNHYLT